MRPDAPQKDRPKGDSRAARRSARSARVFVGNVPFATTPTAFAAAFDARGVGARRAALAVDAVGRSRGYGLVTFDDEGAADRAIDALAGLEIDGRPVRLKHDDMAENGSLSVEFLLEGGR